MRPEIAAPPLALQSGNGFKARSAIRRSCVSLESYLGREYLEGESRAALAASCLVAKRPKNLHRDVAEAVGPGPDRWLVSRRERVRPASARPSKYPRGSTTIQHAGPYQSPHQGKRMVSALSSRGRGVSGRRILRASRSSPWMQFVCPVRKHARELLPAVTHVDGGARVQTLRAHDNPSLAHLLHEFEPLSGVPVLINTSLNVRGARSLRRLPTRSMPLSPRS